MLLEYILNTLSKPDIFLLLERFGKMITYQKELKAVEMMVNIAHGFVEEDKLQDTFVYSRPENVTGINVDVLRSLEVIQYVQVHARNIRKEIVHIVDTLRDDEFPPVREHVTVQELCVVAC